MLIGIGLGPGNPDLLTLAAVKEAKKVRNVMSYVPQDMAVDIKLTGKENVLLFAKLYGVADRKKKVDEVLELMGLSERADDRVNGYSGGMRRRLELAQALVLEPQVLFLDEPTLGLDVSARRKMWEHDIFPEEKRRDHFYNNTLHGRGRQIL